KIHRFLACLRLKINDWLECSGGSADPFPNRAMSNIRSVYFSWSATSQISVPIALGSCEILGFNVICSFANLGQDDIFQWQLSRAAQMTMSVEPSGTGTQYSDSIMAMGIGYLFFSATAGASINVPLARNFVVPQFCDRTFYFHVSKTFANTIAYVSANFEWRPLTGSRLK
ncbi:MAG TPA: hypothetical protein VIY48_22375, partial [Candidatus Paceibacterota bacterium]